MKKLSDIRKVYDVLLGFLAFAIVLCLEIFAFPIPFFTNDQTLMRDIASGIYFGVPDGHLVYIMYPLGWIFSFLYSISGRVVWYDIFMFLTFPIAGGIIAWASSEKLENLLCKLLALVTVIISFLSIYSYFIVQNEYTVDAGVWGVTGLLVLILNKDGKIRKYIISVICLTFSLWLRKEIFLMLLPVILVILAWKYFFEHEKNVIRYSLILCIIAVLSFAINFFAYSSPEWKAYKEYNQARTEVFDYYGFPAYEEIKEMLASEGVSESDYELVGRGIGYMDDADGKKLKSIAKAAKDLHDRNQNLSDVKINLLYNLKLQYVSLKKNYLGRGILILGLLLCILTMLNCFSKKSAHSLLNLIPVAGICGYSLIFMVYFLYKGRFPERISLPLFSMVFWVLFAFLLIAISEANSKVNVAANAVVFLAFGLLGAIQFPKERAAIAENIEFWDSWISVVSETENYCNNNPGELFVIDPSIANYKCDYMIHNTYSSAKNALQLGYWTVGSPMYEKRKANQGFFVNAGNIESDLPVHYISFSEGNIKIDGIAK